MTSPNISTISIVLDSLYKEAPFKLANAREQIQELESFGIINEWLD